MIDEEEVRFDANTEPHAHFKCRKCGRILDIFDKGLFKIDCNKYLHNVEEIHIYFIGLCAECLDNK